jgi:hypothetical protein
MNQVGVNVQHGGRTVILRHHVRIPDFFKHCFSHVVLVSESLGFLMPGR